METQKTLTKDLMKTDEDITKQILEKSCSAGYFLYKGVKIQMFHIGNSVDSIFDRRQVPGCT